jgi:hypothetical protein
MVSRIRSHSVPILEPPDLRIYGAEPIVPREWARLTGCARITVLARVLVPLTQDRLL